MIGGNNTRTGQKREFIVNGLVGPGNKEKFTLEDPTTKAKRVMTVVDYFSREKGVRYDLLLFNRHIIVTSLLINIQQPLCSYV
jgi:hypothetical protein